MGYETWEKNNFSQLREEFDPKNTLYGLQFLYNDGFIRSSHPELLTHIKVSRYDSLM